MNNDYILYELDWNNDIYIDSAISLLCNEWGGSYSTRKERFYNDYLEGINKNYVFLNRVTNIVIGYVSLKRGINKRNQNIGCDTIKIVILYNVVIKKEYRGLGLGTILMKYLEKKVQDDNVYSYIYLFTHNAFGFYEKLLYHRCEAIDNENKALNNLNNESIDMINNIFLKRLSLQSIEVNEKHVWYRKRMKNILRYKIINNTNIINQIHDDDTLIPKENIKIIHKNICYFEQVGPSCGIAAISSVFMTLSEDYQNNISESMMNEAIIRGYSNDGEIFDINHLLELAKLNVTNNNYNVRIECTDIINTTIKLKELYNNDETIIIIPYDKGNEHHQPCLFGGKYSHYAYIIGYIGQEDDDDDDKLKLVVMHSLSCKPIVSSLHNFVESNKNLTHYNSSKEYIISRQGPNLCNKILILTKL